MGSFEPVQYRGSRENPQPYKVPPMYLISIRITEFSPDTVVFHCPVHLVPGCS